jgi:hypothetical protein
MFCTLIRLWSITQNRGKLFLFMLTIFALYRIHYYYCYYYHQQYWSLCLLDRHSTTWALPPALFTFVIFQIVTSFCHGLGSDGDPPPSTSCTAGITDVHYHARLFDYDWVSLTFCSGWTQTIILLISAFWVAGITGVSHCSQTYFYVFVNSFCVV